MFIFSDYNSYFQCTGKKHRLASTLNIQAHLQKIAMPVGGFGIGSVSLKGNGTIQDWQIMNRPAKGFAPWLLNGPPVKVEGMKN